MKQTAYSGVALAQSMELAISQVALKCFDIPAFLNRLNRVKYIPKEMSDEAIHIMMQVLFKCVPMKGYDINDLELRHNHLMSITLLTRLQQVSQRVRDAFQPGRDQLIRLQLARMLKS